MLMYDNWGLQVLELGALKKLMMMVKSSCIEEGIKAFYAISALIRNNLVGQELFCAEAGGLMLQVWLDEFMYSLRVKLIVPLTSVLWDSVHWLCPKGKWHYWFETFQKMKEDYLFEEGVIFCSLLINMSWPTGRITCLSSCRTFWST